MSDIPIRNVQLSTFNGVTERAHGEEGYGDRHDVLRQNAQPAFVALDARPSSPVRKLHWITVCARIGG